MPDREVVVDAFPRAFVWQRAKPGITLFGAHLGSFVVTSRQVLFLSSTLTGVAAGLFYPAASLERLSVAAGNSAADVLDLGALANDGSFALPLSHIVAARIARRLPFTAYLRLEAIHSPGAPPRMWSIMDRYGLRHDALARIGDAIEHERAAMPPRTTRRADEPTAR